MATPNGSRKHTDVSQLLSIVFYPWNAAKLVAELAARGYLVTPATLSGT